MRRILGAVGLALALVLLPAARAQDKKADPKDDKDKPKDTKAAVEKMHVAGEVTGKLIQWGSTDKGFTVEVPVTYYTLNEGEARALAQAQINLAKARSAQDLINARNDMMNHEAKLYTAKTEHLKIDFVPSADMKVRIKTPVVYDDKGKPKKSTRTELDEMKCPNKKLPGYNADASDVKQDMIVTVYIEKKKKSKTKDDKGLADTKPEALMLLIVADPAAAK